MASKTASTSKKKKGPRQPASLISKLNLKLLQDRGRHCFNDWFSAEEIDRFRDNADTSVLDPLFERYQVRMEAALEDFAREEGLSDPTEIIAALRETRDERDEWKKLDKMIDTMTKKEEFFIMVRGAAEQRPGVRAHSFFFFFFFCRRRRRVIIFLHRLSPWLK